MASVPQNSFYAHLYDVSGTLSKVNGALTFFADSGDITSITPADINFLVVLGECRMADDQHRKDAEKSRMTFTEALQRAEVLAKEKLPYALYERINRGVDLVRNGKVFENDDGTWEVHGSDIYAVSTHACTCPDYLSQRARYCKHQLAVFLYRRALTLMKGA